MENKAVREGSKIKTASEIKFLGAFIIYGLTAKLVRVFFKTRIIIKEKLLMSTLFNKETLSMNVEDAVRMWTAPDGAEVDIGSEQARSTEADRCKELNRERIAQEVSVTIKGKKENAAEVLEEKLQTLSDTVSSLLDNLNKVIVYKNQLTEKYNFIVELPDAIKQRLYLGTFIDKTDIALKDLDHDLSYINGKLRECYNK